jgi:hypothetical protein
MIDLININHAIFYKLLKSCVIDNVSLFLYLAKSAH